MDTQKARVKTLLKQYEPYFNNFDYQPLRKMYDAGLTFLTRQDIQNLLANKVKRIDVIPLTDVGKYYTLTPSSRNVTLIVDDIATYQTPYLIVDTKLVRYLETELQHAREVLGRRTYRKPRRKSRSKPRRKSRSKPRRKSASRGRKMYTGPRGGKYYKRNGRKVYV